MASKGTNTIDVRTSERSADHTNEINELFELINGVDRKKIRCMMGLIVVEERDSEALPEAKGFVLGSPDDVHQMLKLMAESSLSAFEGLEEQPNQPTKEKMN